VYCGPILFARRGVRLQPVRAHARMSARYAISMGQSSVPKRIARCASRPDVTRGSRKFPRLPKAPSRNSRARCQDSYVGQGHVLSLLSRWRPCGLRLGATPWPSHDVRTSAMPSKGAIGPTASYRAGKPFRPAQAVHGRSTVEKTGNASFARPGLAMAWCG